MKKMIAILLTTTMLASCGESIRSGEVGVRVRDMGSRAGVQEQELGVGWYMSEFGSYILKFPTTVRTEVWSDQENAGGPAMQFNNSDGVPTRVAVSIQLRVSPDTASVAVQRYRLGFADMIDGPVRRRIQDAFVQEGATYSSEQLVSGEGARLLTAVHERVRAPLAAEGIVIENLALVGPFALPDSIRERINQRVEAQQNAEAEEAQVRVIEARARQRVAEAEGLARAVEIEGQALARNPQILRQRGIEKWNGLCPIDAEICAPGGNALIAARGG